MSEYLLIQEVGVAVEMMIGANSIADGQMVFEEEQTLFIELIIEDKT